ncbi:MAG: efflux RND transporter periplasmic adaptor subunit [Saprospiraceae bacterium]
MRYTIGFILLSIFLVACQPSPTVSDNVIPEDMEGKKALLEAKRTELKNLNAFITELEEKISVDDPSFGKRTKLITTVDAKQKDFNHYVEIQGAVEADDLVDVTSEIAGRILSLKIKEGQNVKQGQLIAELDLEQIKKQMAELETSIELATTIYERQKRLWDQNIGAEIQYLEAKNNKERLEKSMETLSFQLTKGKVYAPISGLVEREILQSGEIASPGMPIIQILNTNRLKVVADVPENFLRNIKVGETVNIHFPALEMERTGKVSRIGATIDPGNRTFTVEVDMLNNGAGLKPNLLAIMRLNDFSLPNAVVIPLHLVQQEVSGKDFVFVTEKGEKGLFAKKVYVQPGFSYQGEVLIEHGLKGGEQLIDEGGRGLTEDALVELHSNANPTISSH